jgi:hypothetical protein
MLHQHVLAHVSASRLVGKHAILTGLIGAQYWPHDIVDGSFRYVIRKPTSGCGEQGAVPLGG